MMTDVVLSMLKYCWMFMFLTQKNPSEGGHLDLFYLWDHISCFSEVITSTCTWSSKEIFNQSHTNIVSPEIDILVYKASIHNYFFEGYIYPRTFVYILSKWKWGKQYVFEVAPNDHFKVTQTLSLYSENSIDFTTTASIYAPFKSW